MLSCNNSLYHINMERNIRNECDFISLFRGEYWKCQWHETKVFFYFLSNALIVSVEYLIIHTILSKIF
jgi:hypothetical protein